MQLPLKRGEIWYACLDPVIGSEQGGTRPVLILQNDKGNMFSPTVVVAAITGKTEKKRGMPIHIPISCPGLKKESVVLLEQVRTLDRQRIDRYVGKLNCEDLRKVSDALRISLGI